MDGFLRSPMVRITIPFILGICLFVYFEPVIKAGLLLVILGSAMLLFHLNILLPSWKFRWLGGLLIYLLFFFSGYELARLKTDKTAVAAWVEAPGGLGKIIYRCEVITDPELKGKNSRMVLKVKSACDSTGQLTPLNFACLAYVPADSAVKVPLRGDILLCRAILESFPGPMNPGEFDFKEYLSGRNIHCRCFMAQGEWKIAGHRQHPLKDLALRCRDFVYHRMEIAGVSGSELALVAALLLGMTSDIETDVKQSYSVTGAMHVLSVSGLHVGIIYMVLNFLLKGLSRLKYGEVIRFSLILSTIWFYAMITGFSPSVLRASMMFSVLQAGKIMKNQPPVMNTLASSAFILLLADPLVLTQIGFQFSYLAVVGIVALTGPVQETWQPSGWITGNIWSLLVVSVAAQIATGPLSIHYFHQFPLLFLLTNLMIIPLTSVTMYLALLVLAAPFQQMATLLGLLLTFSLRMMTGSVRLVESIPGSLISNISLPAIDTILIYLFLIFLCLALIDHFRMALFPALATIIVFLGLQNYYQFRDEQRKEICIYSLPGYGCIDLVSGNCCVSVYTGEEIPENTLKYSVLPHRTELGISETDTIILCRDSCDINSPAIIYGDFIGFMGIRLFIADDHFRLLKNENIPVDLVLVTRDFNKKIEDLFSAFSCNEIVIDGTVPPWKAERIEQECKELDIACHPVSRLGYWNMSL